MPDAGPELEQGHLMYLGMTGSEDWRPAVCDCWYSEKGIGGAAQVLGEGQF